MRKIKETLKVIFCLALFSCDQKLDIEPAQSISVDKALSEENTIKNILIGTYEEAGQSASFGGRNHVISDLLGASDQISWEGTFLEPRQIFTKNILVDNSFVEGLWQNSYEVINQANLVIDNITVINQTNESNRVEGEAKFLRALAYFDLVRHFGGVPLRTEGIVDYSSDLNIQRSSEEEIYNQIISDLNDSYNLLPQSNDFFADKYAAKALLARVYLQRSEYSNALDAAHDVIVNSGHELADTFAGAFNNDVDGVEDIFAFQVTSQGGTNQCIIFYASQSNGGRQGDITLQPAYFELFGDDLNDARYSFNYISPDNGGTLTSKFTNQYGNVPVLRMAEMHLIRAESNFRLSSSKGMTPLSEINTLRARSNAKPLSELSIDVIFNERQLELAFEGHLIHDHKRLGKNVGSLQSNDPKLLLPIPQSEMDSNSEMVQNPGY